MKSGAQNLMSEKQWRFLRGEDKRINLLSGSVRSGKTWVSLLKWAFFVGSMPQSCEFIMCGKTLTSLKRNCLNLLAELVGGNNFAYSLSQKSAELFGRRVWLEGANDERAEGKIRGLTIGGAYCDELTLFPQGFYTMLLSRLSVPGARLYATTNPDAPSHWVKTDVIDNEKIRAQFSYWHFVLEDNRFNDPQYVEDLKREYTGVFYDRFILGLWKRAEGLIYDLFDQTLHVVPSVQRGYTKYHVSVDYGTQNPTAFGLWGLHGGVWYKCKEYHYSGRAENRQKTDREFADDYAAFVKGLPVASVIVDPSAASFIAELKQRGAPVRKAENAVLDGIRLTASLLQRGTIKICDCCRHTIEEFGLYAWDKRAAAEDKPVKENDHHMDETRYFCATVLREKGRLRFT